MQQRPSVSPSTGRGGVGADLRWQGVFDEMGIRTVVDPAGRKAIPTIAARRLLAALRRRDELFAEDHARRSAESAAKYPLPSTAGVPAVEGMTPFESLVAAGVVTVTPEQEFGGREKPRFLQDALEAGARADAEAKREAAAKAAQRLVDQAKTRLGGKR